ncbi:3400_t:CDS:2 [Acaulospora colombiana]|uniref:3400_t:CDS:1 n=1 Tax=Acaulospora colombiana TaxID=27376 RepID=A0ACA9M1T0_9GLOM|nr:3400_t:CDS:2 [Acaulospora colombiana]
MSDDNLGFLPPVYFRPKNPLPSPPPSARKPERSNSYFRSPRPKLNYYSNYRKRNKQNKSYEKYSISHNNNNYEDSIEDSDDESRRYDANLTNQISSSTSAMSKWNHQEDDEDEEKNKSIGRFQRSLSSFMFRSKSVDTSTATFIPYKQQGCEVEETIANEGEAQHRPGRLGGFQRSLARSQFGAKSIGPANEEPISSSKSNRISKKSNESISMKCGGFQRTLKDYQFGTNSNTRKINSNKVDQVDKRKRMASVGRIKIISSRVQKNQSPSASDSDAYDSSRNPSRKRIRPESEMDNNIPGPIGHLPPMTGSRENAFSIVMENCCNQSSMHPEPLKFSRISEDEWIAVLDTVFLPEEMANESIKYTISAIHQMVDYKKRIPVTIGRVAKFDSTKRIITVEDCTGEIQAVIHEKVLLVYGHQLKIGAIIVLTNLAFLRVEGNNYLNITLANIHWVSGSDQNDTPQLVNDKTPTFKSSLRPDNEKNSQVFVFEKSVQENSSNQEKPNASDSVKSNETEKAISPDNEDLSGLWSNLEDPEDLSWMLDDLEGLT